MNYLIYLFCVNAIGASLAEVDQEIGKTHHWALGAYDWLQQQNCSTQIFASQESCLLMRNVAKKDVRVYSVDPTDSKFGYVFPNGEDRAKTYHDAVLVLDPFPHARFGHPILVFRVDTNVLETDCEALSGFSVRNSCLRPLYRNYCNKYEYNYRSRLMSVLGPNCGEIVFLPLVYKQSDQPTQSNDKLRCFSNFPEFDQSCPELRSVQETKKLSCDPLLTNRGCDYIENTIASRCVAAQTCDYAVLLSGGWNRQLSDSMTFQNVMNMKRLLMSHGYLNNNIETFYANGPDIDYLENAGEAQPLPYYSASMKTKLRNHIKTLCDTEYCADTVLLYLNSPTKPDGTSLLWDVSQNGMYDETELYSVRELMRDISHCKANRVIVIADQSYGGALVSAAQDRFTTLDNVLIFSSNDEFDYNATVTDRLTKQLLRAKYTDICLRDFKASFYQTNTPPVFIGSNTGLLNTTLVGAPCTEKPTLLTDPDSSKYRGCNLSRSYLTSS